jgi:hypothetical protein
MRSFAALAMVLAAAPTPAAAAEATGAVGLRVNLDPATFSYTVAVQGETWLHSSPVRAYFEHTEHPSPAKSGPSVASSGADEIGKYAAQTQQWTAGGVAFSTAVKSYYELRGPDHGVVCV